MPDPRRGSRRAPISFARQTDQRRGEGDGLADQLPGASCPPDPVLVLLVTADERDRHFRRCLDLNQVGLVEEQDIDLRRREGIRGYDVVDPALLLPRKIAKLDGCGQNPEWLRTGGLRL